MKPFLSACQHRHADLLTSEWGLPASVLMERAALAVVSDLFHRGEDTSRVLVVCGTGNNGGDGAAIARILDERGVKVTLLDLGSPDRFTDLMKMQHAVLDHTGVLVSRDESLLLDEGYTLILDCMFGIGLTRDLSGPYLAAVESINRHPARVISVDIPSGIDADSGKVWGEAVRADRTITFSEWKPGLALDPGRQYAGEVTLKRIGIFTSEEKSDLFALEDSDIGLLPARDQTGNKGSFGKVLICAGSRQMSGAAYLAARAVLRSGCGMVKILTAEENRSILASLLPESLIVTLRADMTKEERTDLVSRSADWADACLIGPGIGREAEAAELMRIFLEVNTRPAVIDADGLNILADHPDLWSRIRFPFSITPHIGEMSRLAAVSCQDLKADPLGYARALAGKRDCICLLKDAVSVTAAPDGRAWINRSGCSALATAGSGDVLAGLLAGLLARFPSLPYPHAALAAHIHGRLGEITAGERSESAVIASDLTEALARILD